MAMLPRPLVFGAKLATVAVLVAIVVPIAYLTFATYSGYRISQPMDRPIVNYKELLDECVALARESPPEADYHSADEFPSDGDAVFNFPIIRKLDPYGVFVSEDSVNIGMNKVSGFSARKEDDEVWRLYWIVGRDVQAIAERRYESQEKASEQAAEEHKASPQ